MNKKKNLNLSGTLQVMTEALKNLDTLFTSAWACATCANYNCSSAVARLLRTKHNVLHHSDDLSLSQSKIG